MVMADTAIQEDEKDNVQRKYGGDMTVDVLETDVSVAKWRVAKDGKTGYLELKKSTGLEEIEAILLNALSNHGGTRMQGIATKGGRASALDEALSGAGQT